MLKRSYLLPVFSAAVEVVEKPAEPDETKQNHELEISSHFPHGHFLFTRRKKGERNVETRSSWVGWKIQLPFMTANLDSEHRRLHGIILGRMRFVPLLKACFFAGFHSLFPWSRWFAVFASGEKKVAIGLNRETVRDQSFKLSVIIAEVPLAETFGYSTDLRSQTQGQGTFTMELSHFDALPAHLQEKITAEYRKDASDCT